MADLFWPGDERAGDLFQPEMLLGFLVRVEEAWLDTLVRSGPAPAEAAASLHRLVSRRDLDQLAVEAESSGNPVVPLVALLRSRLEDSRPEAARWLHRGLTSQDVMDTALVLCARGVVAQVRAQVDVQVSALTHLAERHRDDVMAGRTLTQHAVPITFGLKAAQWLQGVLDARDELGALAFPVQVGGAAGTLAAVVDLAGDVDAAQLLVAETARSLELDVALPWHTSRSPVTRYADALVRATDAWGHIANDVLLLARPEIGELAEPMAQGRGGSSTMPHKANPVLSVLVRRAALTAPNLAAQLHLAAATTLDERPDGSWHTEWSALATLSRRAVTAGSQVAELLDGLHVDTGRMAAVVKQQASALLAEQRSLAGLSGVREGDFEPRHYLGTHAQTIDAVLRRARHIPTQQEEE
jgi:3-carboxy-cis,cis-muconate cycloisomerase